MGAGAQADWGTEAEWDVIARPTARRQRRESSVRCMAGSRAASMRAPGHRFICRCPARDWAADEFPGLDGRLSLRGGRDGVCCQSGTATATIQVGREGRGSWAGVLYDERIQVNGARCMSFRQRSFPRFTQFIPDCASWITWIYESDGLILSAFCVLRHQSSLLPFLA